MTKTRQKPTKVITRNYLKMTHPGVSDYVGRMCEKPLIRCQLSAFGDDLKKFHFDFLFVNSPFLALQGFIFENPMLHKACME